MYCCQVHFYVAGMASTVSETPCCELSGDSFEVPLYYWSLAGKSFLLLFYYLLMRMEELVRFQVDSPPTIRLTVSFLRNALQIPENRWEVIILCIKTFLRLVMSSTDFFCSPKDPLLIIFPTGHTLIFNWKICCR